MTTVTIHFLTLHSISHPYIVISSKPTVVLRNHLCLSLGIAAEASQDGLPDITEPVLS